MLDRLQQLVGLKKEQIDPRLLIYPQDFEGKKITYPIFSRRLASACGDCIFLLLLMFPLTALLNMVLFPHGLTSEVRELYNAHSHLVGQKEIFMKALVNDYNYISIMVREFIIQIVTIIFALVIIVYSGIKYHTTPGKRLFKYYILDADTYQYASKKQLIIRSICYGLSIFTLFIGVLMAIFNPRRRMLHDYIAKTIVVKLT